MHFYSHHRLYSKCRAKELRKAPPLTELEGYKRRIFMSPFGDFSPLAVKYNQEDGTVREVSIARAQGTGRLQLSSSRGCLPQKHGEDGAHLESVTMWCSSRARESRFSFPWWNNISLAWQVKGSKATKDADSFSWRSHAGNPRTCSAAFHYCGSWLWELPPGPDLASNLAATSPSSWNTKTGRRVMQLQHSPGALCFLFLFSVFYFWGVGTNRKKIQCPWLGNDSQ